jgi:hypothetical protein
MNDDIVILISQDNTIQMRLAMRLEQLFVEKKVGRVENKLSGLSARCSWWILE